jgi:hypothetical protein
MMSVNKDITIIYRFILSPSTLLGRVKNESILDFAYILILIFIIVYLNNKLRGRIKKCIRTKMKFKLSAKIILARNLIKRKF